MRIFNTTSAPTPTSAKSIKDQKGPKDGEFVESTGLGKERGPRRLIQRHGLTNQPFKSDLEIREQLMKSTDILRRKKIDQALKNQRSKETSSFMGGEEAKGDVGFNNPNDPATVGKLKDLVSSGGFSFSDKERGVLEQILKDR